MSGKKIAKEEHNPATSLHTRHKEVRAGKVKAPIRFVYTYMTLLGVIVGSIFLAFTVFVQQQPNIPTALPQETDTSATDCSVEKCVALTFDDGPTLYTTELLDILEQNNTKATFFFQGSQINEFQSDVVRANRNGHDIGNHTWSHINITGSSAETIADEVTRTQDIITSLTGTTPILFRPPGGFYKYENIGQIKLHFILWQIDPQEWRELDADTIYKDIMEKVSPGVVVISHDTRSSTIEAYRRIIPDLIEQGYSLVTITDLFNIEKNDTNYKAYY